MSALLRAELVSRWRVLAGLTVGLFAFMFVMASTYQSLGVGMLGSAFSAHTPKAVSAFSGTPGASLLTPSGWLGFGFAHPTFLVLSATVAIAIPSASIAGEVESGRAELLFARPQTRRRLLAVSVGVWAIGQLIVAAGALGGTLAGSLLDSDIAGLGIVAMLAATLQSLTVFAFVAAVAFLASARARTRGAAIGVTIAVVAGLYLVNFISGLVDGLGWVRWLSPFGYYSPAATLADGLAFGDVAVLLGAAAVLMLLAAVSLDRRDLR
jgi:ABC-2 type transport system permease protein